MVVARYLATGALNAHFGSGGKGVLSASDNAVAGAVAVGRDGKIAVEGSIGTDQALARLRPDGTLDRTFGSGGVARTSVSDLDTGFSDRSAVLITPSGAIVAGTSFLLARYLPNGRLDPTFGRGGEVLAETGSDFASSFQIQSLALDRRGGIIAGGVAVENFALAGVVRPFLGGPLGRNSAVARFTAAGLDTSFGDQGVKRLDNGAGYTETSAAMALQPDGKILAADTDLFRLTAS